MKKILILLCLFYQTSSWSLDNRRQPPKAFKNTYVGFSLGYYKFFYENVIQNQFQIERFSSGLAGMQFYIYKLFENKFGVKLSYDRSIPWAHAYNISKNNIILEDNHSIWNGALNLSLIRQISIKNNLFILLGAGLNWQTTKGFTINNEEVIVQDANLGYMADLSINYVFKGKYLLSPSFKYYFGGTRKQPNFLFAGLNFGIKML